MQVHHSIIIILLTITWTVGPAEAGFFNWAKDKVYAHIPHLPHLGKTNKVESSNSIDANGKGEVEDTGDKTITGTLPDDLGTSKSLNENEKGADDTQDHTETQISTRKSHHSVSIHDFANGFGSANGVVLWSGDVYWLNRRLHQDKHECIEEINLSWHEGKVGKTFKPNCIKYGSFRNVFHEKGLLLLGSPDEDFFVFSSKKNEYYYKENGKWKKGNIDDGEVKEAEMTSYELKKVMRRINKWIELTDKSNNNIKNVAAEQMKEAQRSTQELRRINGLMMEAARKTQKNLQEIGRLRYEEYGRQVEDQVKFDAMVRNQGWNNDVEKVQNEMGRRSQQAENEIRAKESTEQARYKRVNQDLHNKLVNENARHHQENHKASEQYVQENERFARDYNLWIKRGY